MIRSINISNYALIERTEMLPSEGFNVITGETGAGKSILLGAIGLTLGQRADVSVLKDNTKKCVVEVYYNVEDYGMTGWFEENGLDYDGNAIVRREISVDGKSRAFINDTPVNIKLLKDFGNAVIDIHSQHQSLLLGRPEYQIELLDAFAGNTNLVAVFREKYEMWRRKKSELEVLKKKSEEIDKEKDYLNFRLAQLDSAALKEGEKEKLEEELNFLSNTETIMATFNKTVFKLRDEEGAVIDTLKGLRNALGDLKNVVKEANDYESRLESIIIDLKDISNEAEYKADALEYNPRRIEEINGRLNVIYELLYKFKKEEVEELLEIRQNLSDKLYGIQNADEKLIELGEEILNLEKEMDKDAKMMHEKRESSCEGLREIMKKLLVELGIKHAEFVVDLHETDKFNFNENGTDEVKFMFAANKNQPLGDLSKVASGGEISRVMLALKYMLSRSKHLPVIIFDEIDTGLSGEVAHKMAKMMREMADNMQVISITHLPQIASLGDTHFKVYKEDIGDQTISIIKKLTHAERVDEIAAMISGDKISKSAIETAENLLKH
ncbi:MAG: DNA repair protein RecN [Culturomica sp.]|jgi:DNA repair protein RecN (Recombination protein N)|nr:DNA repair protein RecN [Culturomica sp.]